MAGSIKSWQCLTLPFTNPLSPRKIEFVTQRGSENEVINIAKIKVIRILNQILPTILNVTLISTRIRFMSILTNTGSCKRTRSIHQNFILDQRVHKRKLLFANIKFQVPQSHIYAVHSRWISCSWNGENFMHVSHAHKRVTSTFNTSKGFEIYS